MQQNMSETKRKNTPPLQRLEELLPGSSPLIAAERAERRKMYENLERIEALPTLTREMVLRRARGLPAEEDPQQEASDDHDMVDAGGLDESPDAGSSAVQTPVRSTSLPQSRSGSSTKKEKLASEDEELRNCLDKLKLSTGLLHNAAAPFTTLDPPTEAQKTRFGKSWVTWMKKNRKSFLGWIRHRSREYCARCRGLRNTKCRQEFDPLYACQSCVKAGEPCAVWVRDRDTLAVLPNRGAVEEERFDYCNF